MKYIEFTGKTVDEAVETGLNQLGLTKEQADIRVLEEGKKKLFGSVKARVEIAALEETACEEKREEACEECAPIAKANGENATDGERTVEFLEEKGNTVYPLTKRAYEFYENKKKGDNYGKHGSNE